MGAGSVRPSLKSRHVFSVRLVRGYADASILFGPLLTELRLVRIGRGRNMKSLFVGNMSFQTTENDLRPLFEELGRVSKVQIVMDRETGRPRGFAFVEMPNDDEAIKAIKTLDGREIA